MLIGTDQWRGDSLSILGKPVLRTPFLDELASTGTVMTRAYSPCPTCIAARMSLLSGTLPQTHGRVGYEDGITFDAATSMAKAFGDAGFQTQAIGKMHVYPERNRAGFDNVVLHDGYLHHSLKGRPDPRFYDDYTVWLKGASDAQDTAGEYGNGAHCNAVPARPWDRPEYQHPTNWATDRAIDWLYQRDPDAPFFLFLSYHRPHAPYDPPRWAFDMYRNKDFPDAPRGNWEESFLREHRNNASPQSLVADYPKEVRDDALAGYYGNMTHLDAQIKRFLEALNDFDLADDTIVCFTSDHGDMMGDHGLWRKGLPYQGSSSIPMIFQGPGIAAGQHQESLMDLTDVPATLLDLAGVPVPKEMDSLSYADVLRDHSPSTADQPPYPIPTPSLESIELAPQVREHLHGEHHTFGQSLQWILWRNFKYVWWSKEGREQLFDLAADPDELVDLLLETDLDANSDSGESTAEALAACRSLLTQELEGRPEGFVENGQLIAGRESGPYFKRTEDQLKRKED